MMFTFEDSRITQLSTEPEWISWSAGPDSSEEALQEALQKIAAMPEETSWMTKRAMMLEHLLLHAPVGINPANPLSCRIRLGGAMWEIQNRRKEWGYAALLDSQTMSAVRELDDCGAFISMLDTSHTSPDWASLLRLGLAGLRDRAEQALNQTADRGSQEFFRAVITVYNAACHALKRLAATARTMGAESHAAIFERLAVQPPETLQEALILGAFYDQVQDADAVPVRSQGIFDRLYFPYYQSDLASGRLDRAGAKALLKYYWMMMESCHNPNGKNICLGGMKGPEQDGCNDLTRLAFEIHDELAQISPKLSLRVHPDMAQDVLLSAAECVRKGRTSIVFSNDVTSFEMLRLGGKEPQDVYDHLLIGCYEPAVQGREMCCSMAAWGNIVKPLEAVFSGGVTFDGVRLAPEAPVPEDYAGFEAEYFRILDCVLQSAMAHSAQMDQIWPQVSPSPLISGTMTDCIRSGRDVSSAGTRYNPSGVMCAGLGTAVDALMAVKFLVAESKICTVAQLGDALKANWHGFENWRMLAEKAAPKWGTGDSRADALGKKIVDHLADVINRTPNGKGGFFQLGMWSINHNFRFGKKIGATPDGRLAGMPLSRNLGGSIGKEKNGVTGLIRSALQLDLARSPDGAVLDVLLHPAMVSGANGAQIVADLIRTYFAGGGLHMHFNILDPEILKEARLHPESYSDLQVRVCGWNSRFVNLSAEEQETFIRQASGGC